ncbi:MAG: universal stress protein [Hyphomicrobiales bacterium]|nr:universal stress protein [Hyphomicrobiales bacterium]
MKTILVPVEAGITVTSTLETALTLARKFDSYVEGFAPRVSLTSVVDMDGGVALADAFAQQNLEAEREARNLFERFMESHGVPRGHGSAAVGFGWLESAPEGDQFLGSRGRVFDVTVIGSPRSDSRGSHMALLEVALFESGHPILMAPPSPPREIGTNVLIAWNGSTEQARTTTFALPILRKAGRVTVLTVEGGIAVPGPSAAEMCRYLQFNGVPATTSAVGVQGRSTGEAILATAAALGCDLLVKGAYTQSRLRQMIFGGTTRHILANATLPVLMAH